MNVYCTKCKIQYQIGLLDFLLKRHGCPICRNNNYKLMIGKREKIR